MRIVNNSSRPAGCRPGNIDDLAASLAARIVGQPAAIDAILPCVEMYQAGLAPEGRPVGVFLLLGPSGTGKTKTVEALADVLHHNERNVLRVDCGEFQMEHEVAKLIGAPPGYLGHRETHPMLSQAKLASVTSEHSSLSIVLFDEIEKAASSLARLLLGVLDKAALRLGDNNTVNFERSIIFLTSNLGSRDMLREITPDFGFQAMTHAERPDLDSKLQTIGMNAVRRCFAPEFVNRIDSVVTYSPLDQTALHAILDNHLEDLQQHIINRLGPRGFRIAVSDAVRRFLLHHGISAEFGARELKRTIHRHLIQPVASRMARGLIPPCSTVQIDLDEATGGIRIQCEPLPEPQNKPLSRLDPEEFVIEEVDDLSHLEPGIRRCEPWCQSPSARRPLKAA